jgi:diguanylate cyclase (GGDEF)-like protein
MLSMAANLDVSFQRKLYRAALRDPLTRLYNRRYLLSQLESEFSYVERHRTPLSVVMLDIDHFKQVNDTYGHLVGDEVLAGFAALLQVTIRGEDLAARYGGEEFILVCRGVVAEVALKIAERILRQVGEAALSAEEPDLRVTVSAGVAAVPHPKITTPQELIAAADRALYDAKRAGRNRVVEST